MILSPLLLCLLLGVHASGLHLNSNRISTWSSGRVNASTDGYDGYASSAEKGNLTIGIIIPKTTFNKRAYTKAINDTVKFLNKNVGGKGPKLNFLRNFNFNPTNVKYTAYSLTPSPTAILKSICQEFLSVNVSAILYLMNYEKYGRSTASAQYFLQLAGYLGIPVIAWNADNSGLERRASQSSLQLQLAPSLEHQTAAMLSILERYKWHQFSIVTSQIAGHDDFIQAVRERISYMTDRFKKNEGVMSRDNVLRSFPSSSLRISFPPPNLI
ncbi:hypothetical protein M8J77_005394 [Diaphorina citri]|nr:hypothetical protein M8J77_005394 [Diaphorina citri]